MPWKQMLTYLTVSVNDHPYRRCRKVHPELAREMGSSR